MIRRDPYRVAAGAVLLVCVACAIQHPWSGDLGIHIASIDRLRASLTHPGHPLVDADVPSPYYTPYTVLLALVGRLTGWSTPVVLAVAGPPVVAVLLAGLRAFVRVLSDERLAPLFALLAVLLLWGPRPRVWSGFVQLWALPLTMAYPSTFALALTLLFWAWLARALRGTPVWSAYLGLGMLAAVIAVTHHFTFAMTGLGAAALVAERAGKLSAKTWLCLAAAAAEWLVLVLAWPYYPFFGLSGITGLDDIHKQLYQQPWLYFGLAVVALPALWLRGRRSPRDPLVLLFLGALAVVALGAVPGWHALGRMWPAVLLSAQLALAVELARYARARPAGPAWRGWAAVTALALAAELVVQGPHLAYGVPRGWLPHPLQRLAASWPDYSWITPYVHPGDVVVTSDYYALRSVPGYGARTIPPAWPDPFLTDQKLRWHELAVIHDPRTDAATRQALLEKYHARWVLEIPGSWTISAGRTPVAVGPLGQRLYRVPG